MKRKRVEMMEKNWKHKDHVIDIAPPAHAKHKQEVHS
jgi:hypothetical protein